MRQLKPWVILAFGLPVSLFVNVAVSFVVMSLASPRIEEWEYIAAALAGVVWATLNVPVVLGMGFICHRIDRFSDIRRKTKVAIGWFLFCVTLLFLGGMGVFLCRDVMILDVPIVTAISIVIILVTSILAIATLTNLVIRIFVNSRRLHNVA